MNTVTGTVTDVQRIGCSVNGNPTYKITVDGETYRTKSDAACSYAVSNYRPNRGVFHVVTMGLTAAGRVSTITEVGTCQA